MRFLDCRFRVRQSLAGILMLCIIMWGWTVRLTRYRPPDESVAFDPPEKSADSTVLDGQAYQSGMADASIVVALSGEMANNLMHLAQGYALQLAAKEHFNISTNIILRHQKATNPRKEAKWRSAERDIKQCFPAFRGYDFSLGHRPDIVERLKRWGKHNRERERLEGVNSKNFTVVLDSLQHLANLVQKHHGREETANVSELKFPHVVSNSLQDSAALIDIYYDKIQSHFQFDEESCCALRPHPEETVVHLRAFSSERVSNALQRGYAELPVRRLVDATVGHLAIGSKVALTSRFPNSKAVQDFVAACKTRKLQVRLIAGQTGVQDFCFLMKAKKELVGHARSTFSQWAAYFGESSISRLRIVASDSTHRELIDRLAFNFTHKSLKTRIRYELNRL